jgi:predicted ATP-binding protein involved in virulence
MKLLDLRVQNYRCFSEAALEFGPATTLLVAPNGAGKTAILDALAATLSLLLEEPASQPTLSLRDARMSRPDPKEASVERAFPVRLRLTLDATGTQGELRQSLERSGLATPDASGWSVHRIARFANRVDGASASPLPLIAYFRAHRLFSSPAIPSNPEPWGRDFAYRGCLNISYDSTSFLQWMARNEGDRIQRIAAALEAGGDISAVRTPHLDAVSNAVCACVEGAKRFFYSAAHAELRLELHDGSLHPFSDLSDGQRTLVMLAAEIAWRAVQLNPHWGREAPQHVQGVVLIDEIELHLHPQWQRRAIPDLRRTFPNLQLVLSTHSPQVVASVRPESLRVLQRDGTITGAAYTAGRDTNSLLREVFGVGERPADAQARIDAAEAMLGDGDLDAARRALRALSEDLGPDDDVIRGLAWELHDQEVHGAEGS